MTSLLFDVCFLFVLGWCWTYNRDRWVSLLLTRLDQVVLLDPQGQFTDFTPVCRNVAHRLRILDKGKVVRILPGQSKEDHLTSGNCNCLLINNYNFLTLHSVSLSWRLKKNHHHRAPLHRWDPGLEVKWHRLVYGEQPLGYEKFMGSGVVTDTRWAGRWLLPTTDWSGVP